MNGINEYIEQVTKVCGQQPSFRLRRNRSASPIADAFVSNYLATFQKNFLNRVERLCKAYGAQEENRKVIIKLIENTCFKRNWPGAFAELSAYDYLNFGEEILLNPVVLSKVPDTNTLGRYLGIQADLDCYFGDFNVYVDVKVLKDNVKDQLESVYSDLRKELGRSDFHIMEGDRDLDIDLKLNEHDRQKLLNELISEFRASDRPSIIRSKVIPQFTFKFHWGPGPLGSIRFYNPYRHAEAHYKLAFNYPGKYVEAKPFLLMYVIFPWYNGVINRFNDGNRIFYRCLSRRVFFQHKHDKTQFKTLEPAFNSNLTIYEVSKKLSGIIFLEDHSITSSADLKPTNQYSAFTYLNPNADNPVIWSSFHDYLRSLPRIEIDDFMYDNY